MEIVYLYLEDTCKLALLKRVTALNWLHQQRGYFMSVTINDGISGTEHVELYWLR